jgi:hypothetical protein
VARFFYDWQTLIAALLALLAAMLAIRAANQQIAVALAQMDTTLRLERMRAAREGSAFYAMLAAAMSRVLAEGPQPRAPRPPTLSGSPDDNRSPFSKSAFSELRGACVRYGGHTTASLLELESDIDNFAMRLKLKPKGYAVLAQDQLPVIEAKALHLFDEAFAGIKRMDAVMAEPEPPKRSWRPWRARQRA